MIQPRIHTVQCLSPAGLHSMAYKEWGDRNNPRTLVCVHGLTRVSDDFDQLARQMCSDFRVICPDIVGRGRSGWLNDPQYLSDMVTLIARLDLQQVDWLGTSMGGLVGIALASLAATPVRKLLLNDIGPMLDATALARIGGYLAQELRFDTFEEAASHVRAISASFGPHSEEQWRKIAADVLRQDSEGRWRRHYDLRLAQPFVTETTAGLRQTEQALWSAYDAITCPTLLVRGAQSDLLTTAVAHDMTRRGPRARLVEFAGVGHAPTFVQSDQIAVARDFFGA